MASLFLNTTKKYLIFVGVLTLVVSLGGCSLRGCQKDRDKKDTFEAPLEVVPVKKKVDPKLVKENQRLRVLIQALAVERAAWKVLLDIPENEIISEFYPIVRALGKNQTRIPVPQGKSICDQFEIKNTAEGFWFRMACRKGTSDFAFMKEKDGGLEIEFYPRELADIIGLGASLSAKNFICNLSWTKNSLERMTCHYLSRNRAPQEVVVLEDLIYTAEATSVLKIKGQVYKDLYPISKIETVVPVKGAIDFVETWLPPPPVIEEPVQEEVAKEKTEDIKEKDPNAPPEDDVYANENLAQDGKPVKKSKKVPQPVSPTEGGEGAEPDAIKHVIETDQGDSRDR